jgi:hypothetical protein
MRVLYYSPKRDDYVGAIMVDKIIRFSKSADGDTTFIHLVNGEVLASSDSLKVLAERVERG